MDERQNETVRERVVKKKSAARGIMRNCVHVLVPKSRTASDNLLAH